MRRKGGSRKEGGGEVDALGKQLSPVNNDITISLGGSYHQLTLTLTLPLEATITITITITLGGHTTECGAPR